MRKVYCEIDILYWSRNLDILAINHPTITQLSFFSFFLRVLSQLITSSFFLGLVIQKSATTATSKQQEIEMVCFGIEYYRDAVIKHLHCFFAVVNEKETALIIVAKLNPFFYEYG